MGSEISVNFWVERMRDHIIVREEIDENTWISVVFNPNLTSSFSHDRLFKFKVHRNHISSWSFTIRNLRRLSFKNSRSEGFWESSSWNS
jgi:hypothetical protein